MNIRMKRRRSSENAGRNPEPATFKTEVLLAQPAAQQQAIIAKQATIPKQAKEGEEAKETQAAEEARERKVAKVARHASRAKTSLRSLMNANTYLTLLKDAKVRGDSLDWVERLRAPVSIKQPK